MTVTPDALTQCIAELRRAFGDASRHPKYIETIPRVGVRLLPNVAAIAPAAAAATTREAAATTRWRPWAAAMGVAAAVAAALVLALPRTAPPYVGASAPAERSRTVDEARELYLTARHFHERADFDMAARYAARAIAADPSFALAHSMLAASHAYRDAPLTDPERRARADASSRRAIELDARSAEAQALRAAILWELGDLPAALNHAQRAVELGPDDPYAQQVDAWLRMAEGRTEAALAAMLVAHESEPLSPHAHRIVGQWQYFAGQTDAAIASLERALDLAPEHHGGRRVLALAYFAQGRDRDAIEQYQHLPIAAELKAALRERLADASRGSGTLELGDLPPAVYCAGDGLIAAEALAHFSAAGPMLGCLRSAVERSPYPSLTLGFWMKTEPVFAAYRSDERFAALLRETGLP